MVNPYTGQRMLIPPKLVLSFKPNVKSWKERIKNGRDGVVGKIPNHDLASQILVARHKLDKRDAAIFVSAMFDVIQTNLEKDKIVKVKGWARLRLSCG